MKLKIVAEDKYLPQYANDTDACMDLKARIQNEITEQPEMAAANMILDGFAQLTGMDTVKDTQDSIVIWPGQVRKVPSGVQVAIPEGYVMKIYVRSSIGIKKNLRLANGTGIIDAGYRDEVIMALHNFGKEPVLIKDGDRICQFILLPFPKVELEIVEDNKDFRMGDRGGGIGSTDKKENK